jgi:hypothetical protein
MSTAIDSLDNDAKIHIGIIFVYGYFTCIAQKFIIGDYASGLVFGYGTNTIYFQRKQNGSWLAVREI